LDTLARRGQRAERATDGLTRGFTRLIAPLTAAVSGMAALNKVVDVTRQFDILNAGLVTATGSAENAQIAFEAIQDFATQTPYDLQQATEAFTKLVNYGLTPSEEALRAYGDTSAALGKDLMQMVEAVADATTGEFERLKEFGIKARKEGDQIALTFSGVTTRIQNSGKAIEQYLIELGQNNFAGAMEQRMNTLDGAISNLGDEWDKLFLNISQQGIGDLIEDSVRLAIDALEEMNAWLASGQLTAYIDAIGGKFEGMGRDVATTLDILEQLWDDFLGTPEGGGVTGSTNDTIDFIIEAFKNLPENMRAIIQLTAVEIAALIDYGRAYGRAFAEVIGIELGRMVEQAKVYGRALGDALNPFSDDEIDVEAELRRLQGVASDMADEAFRNAERQASITRDARRESIISIMEERQAALESFDDQIAKADDLRAKYEQLQEERNAGGEDRLAQFQINPEGGADEGPSAAEQKAAQRRQEQREREFGQLLDFLQTEEEAIQSSYDRRLEIIRANTQEESAIRGELEQRLKDKYDAEMEALQERQMREIETIRNSLMTEEEQLKASYERRRQIVLENTQITEEERQQLQADLHENYMEQLQTMEAQRTSIMLQNSSNLFGNLADLSKQFAGEQSTIYKAMFATSKAFAIVDSIIKIQQGIANAASLPFPANLGAMGSVAAATAGIVSTIQGQNFSGAYDNGGRIPAGSVGLVGEIGPELVQGPANVTSRKDTAKMLEEASRGGQDAAAPAPNNVRIINSIDSSVMEDYLGSEAGEEIILNVIRKNPETVRSVGAA
jgi:hypothetical protein